MPEFPPCDYPSVQNWLADGEPKSNPMDRPLTSVNRVISHLVRNGWTASSNAMA
jgi:hypothetical protein